jgi:hypothetical protein
MTGARRTAPAGPSFGLSASSHRRTAMFIDTQLRRACAVLGIRLVHSRPRQPAGRGKIERYPKRPRPVPGRDRRTGRWQPRSRRHRGRQPGRAQQPRSPPGSSRSTTSAATPRPARHRWPGSSPKGHRHRCRPTGWPRRSGGPWRTVSGTATVSLHGNLYEVDPSLTGTKVEPPTAVGRRVGEFDIVVPGPVPDPGVDFGGQVRADVVAHDRDADAGRVQRTQVAAEGQDRGPVLDRLDVPVDPVPAQVVAGEQATHPGGAPVGGAAAAPGGSVGVGVPAATRPLPAGVGLPGYGVFAASGADG